MTTRKSSPSITWSLVRTFRRRTCRICLRRRVRDDARHVATATVHGVRLVVSWNFRHLVNVRREDGFNAVNLLHGWPAIRIVSPKEIIYAQEQPTD